MEGVGFLHCTFCLRFHPRLQLLLLLWSSHILKRVRLLCNIHLEPVHCSAFAILSIFYVALTGNLGQVGSSIDVASAIENWGTHDVHSLQLRQARQLSS